MALPASDTFTGSAGNPISANWTIVAGGFVYALGNATAQATAEINNLAAWNADSFNDDQYSTVTAVLVSAGYVYNGIAVRASTTAVTCYNYAVSADQNVFMDRILAGEAYDLALSSEYGSAGDVLRLEVSGTSITAKRNGAVQFSGAKTDANIASGSAGIYCYGGGANATLDNWEGGNLAAVVVIPVMMHHYKMLREWD